MKLIADKAAPPLGVVISAQHQKGKVEIDWGDATSLTSPDGTKFTSEITICRYLARKFPEEELYGSNALEMTEVDQWLLMFSGMKGNDDQELFRQLDAHLQMKGRLSQAFLVGKHCTVADYLVWGFLYGKTDAWKDSSYAAIKQYYKLVEQLGPVKKALNSLPGNAKKQQRNAATGDKGKSKGAKPNVSDDTLESLRKEDAKFVDLPGAEIGKVVVRFPPEASGFLHIGHAKAALLNQYYKEAFQGTLIMRFDDTNPAKEKVDFEKVILEDLDMLKITPNKFSYTSDYFELMLSKCEEMLKNGSAYVDDTNPEVMKNEREQKIESKNRNNSVEKNLAMWEEMKKGTAAGLECCVRAKIDMQSLNGCMRDPTIYRCKTEPHPRTGTKYKVYPTYDFACPIVDSLERVTHCLRTMEYHDRDAQFYWFIDTLKMPKPYIWEYSRLNMTNTVLSKRKLTWFVENNLVQGWDDPRMPTVRGILRRGLTVEGLKQFVIAQGSSRSVVVMEWDKIWAFNKKVIDPVAPRYTAVESKNAVPVYVKDAVEEALTAPKHPKNPDVGEKKVWTSKKIWIDQADAKDLVVGNNVTFINWGNIKIEEIIKDSSGEVKEVKAVTNLDNKDYKKTLKLTWLADTPKAPFIPCCCVYFNHIISKPVLGKDEDFKQFIDHETQVEVMMFGDTELASLKKSDIIQLQRKGFFICDSPYQPTSVHSGKPSPIVLFYIPDGHTKEDHFSKTTSSVPEKKAASPVKSSTAVSADTISEKIKNQGDKVRILKQQKAEKATIEQEVKALLALKEEFKQATGKDWQPNAVSKDTSSDEKKGTSLSVFDLDSKIVLQGNNIRNLKSQKADKATIDKEVKVLLSLKEEFKKAAGKDWQPNVVLKETTKEPSTGVSNQVVELNNKITEQGNVVRTLKSQKADKAAIDKEVKLLLSLKEEFKKAAGKDWHPNVVPKDSAKEIPKDSSKDESELNNKIAQQGNLVRNLKSQKADKATIDKEVKVLLSLKEEYKKAVGKDWKPGSEPKNAPKDTPKEEVKDTNKNVSELDSKITEQGNVVRNLKSQKADKQAIDSAVKVLLSLKDEYKQVTGNAWKPSDSKPSEIKAPPNVPQAQDSAAKNNQITGHENLVAMITEQGDLVRNLKKQSADKETINEAVKKLLSLKEEYKTATGQDYQSEGQNNSGRKSKGDDKKGKANLPKQKLSPQKKKVETPAADGAMKKVTRLGLEAAKEDNLPEWYSQVLTKGEMIEYYDVSGCYVLRPWSFAIWEVLRDWFDGQIKQLGVKNCYFPMFVSRSVLEKEKAHIADFAPEVAWVTKSGSSDLAEPIAIRPTSETVMYPAYAKWIQSHRDLPLRLNQWNNVVRWEFKHPQPFLRTREFLWQEGHTAFSSKEEAEEEVSTILDLYARVYSELLAIPVVKGRKTEKEKFAGGDYTLTTEAFISASGRAIQGATSHHLGQNFSKMFDICYEDPETQEKKYVYQNSWGFTTRTIGVLIMVHADNQGLVLPPRVASIQAIIVACGIAISMSEQDKETLYSFCRDLDKKLNDSGIKSSTDLRENYSPGWKFNHWELKGVPLRIEVGPKDLKANQIVVVRRDTGSKETIKNDNSLVDGIKGVLDNIQSSLLAKAKAELDSHMKLCKNWDEFCNLLNQKNLLLSPFCGEISCEDNIKQDSAREDADGDSAAPAMGAKGLCIPFEQPQQIIPSDKCIHFQCKNKPLFYTLFGRSY